jgi:hypothetical protein
MIDSLALELEGEIEWAEGSTFDDYLERVLPSTLFTAAPTPGTRYISKIGGDWLSISGRLELLAKPRLRQAKVAIVIQGNPTRTRRQAVQMAAREGVPAIEQLPSHRFFWGLETWEDMTRDEAPSPRQEKVLDGSSNVLLGLAQLGGQWVTHRQHEELDYIQLYEDRLRTLLLSELLPSRIDQPCTIRDFSTTTDDGRFRVTLDWPKAKVKRCEVYWEREHPDPVGVVAYLDNRAMDLARSLRSTHYGGKAGYASAERSDGLPTTVVPLTGEGNVELAIYAKTSTRVRFEVRFKRNLSRFVRSVGGEPASRVTRLLTRLKDEAASRLPWSSLARLAAEAPPVQVTHLVQLATKLRDATTQAPALFEPVMLQLMTTGGVSGTEARLPGVSKVIRRLERLKVLERVPLQTKEGRQRRRWGLTLTYAALRQRLEIGFSPTPVELDPFEANYPPWRGEDAQR